jgi:fructose-1,6-bisphosphatase/inositol monophosphatase family enzyme
MQTAKISSLIKKVADNEITPRFRNLREDEVLFKEPGEFVTAADLAAEFALSDGLRALYPNAIITGEEDISKNPMRLV